MKMIVHVPTNRVVGCHMVRSVAAMPCHAKPCHEVAPGLRTQPAPSMHAQGILCLSVCLACHGLRCRLCTMPHGHPNPTDGDSSRVVCCCGCFHCTSGRASDATEIRQDLACRLANHLLTWLSLIRPLSQVGPDAGEIMQGLGVALKCGATKAQFDSCVGIHPSAAEEWVTMSTPAR